MVIMFLSIDLSLKYSATGRELFSVTVSSLFLLCKAFQERQMRERGVGGKGRVKEGERGTSCHFVFSELSVTFHIKCKYHQLPLKP